MFFIVLHIRRGPKACDIVELFYRRQKAVLITLFLSWFPRFSASLFHLVDLDFPRS